jgi:hypothetical protein
VRSPRIIFSLLFAAGCTDVSLYGKVGQEPQLADKVALTGVLCTDNPATRKFPVKIMFIVDASAQMGEAAPLGEHVLAIEQTLSMYLPIPNVFVGIVRYDTGATQLTSEMSGRVTSGFTRDAAIIDNALINLRATTGARNLPAALSLVRSIITGDTLQADRGPLSRTKYVLVHVTSGSPDPVIPADFCEDFDPRPANCELTYLERSVQDLRDFVLDEGAAEFDFHTISIEQPAVEGAPCDPRMPAAAQCPQGAGLLCVQTGIRVDTGRCVQPCDPNAPICNVLPGQATCVSSALPGGAMLNHCARGETSCFDGIDNDGDGKNIDCSDPEYPYFCNQNTGACENDCRFACRSEDLGVSMTLAGNGRYERIQYSDQVSFARIDFRSTQRLFVMKEMLAYNRNAVAKGLELLADSDADGLSDSEEDGLGLDALAPDSDGDYFNDKLEHILRVLGTDPTRTTTIADCDDPTLDTDGDSLRDCEEKLLGSDKTLFDTDADGFPDHIEFRAGTNVLFADTLDDLDLDGQNNGKELRAHTDVLSNDAKTKNELAYRTRILDLGPTADLRNCYDVRISNITLVNTRDRGFGTGVNDIDVYFGQVPQGDLEAYGLYHVAQVRVQYFPPDRRDPDTPAIDVEDGDFVFFEQ